jgi:site-specific recombinase XerD
MLAIFAAFENYLKDIRKFSPATSKAYLGDLLFLAEYLSEQHGLSFTGDEADVFAALAARQQPAGDSVTAKVCACKQEDLKAYLQTLAQPGKLQAASVHRRQSSLSSFYKWAMSLGVIVENPAVNLGAQKVRKALVEYMPPWQFEELLKAIGGSKLKTLRDRAILMLLYEVGLTAGVTMSLDEADLQGGCLTYGAKLADPSNGGIRKTGRQACQRVLTAQTRQALEEYRAAKPVSDVPGMPLFVNKIGERIDARTIRRNLEKYAKAAGLPPSLSPVDFRYSAIVNALASGTSPTEVSRLFGYRAVGALSRFARVVEDVRTGKFSRPAPQTPPPAPVKKTVPASAAPPLEEMKPPRGPSTTSKYGRATPLQPATNASRA